MKLRGVTRTSYGDRARQRIIKMACRSNNDLGIAFEPDLRKAFNSII